MSSGEPTATEDSAQVDLDEEREALLARFAEEIGDALVASHIRPGHALWVRVDRSAWATAAAVAKGRLGYDFFDFLSAIDWLPSPFGRDMDSQEDRAVHGAEAGEPAPMTWGTTGGETRFQLLARVYDVGSGAGLILKADLPDDDLVVETWTDTYHGADWHERETWEMFGITFVGHPNLRHIYLPGDFEGFPLRKDFPLLSRRVKPWPGIVDVEPMPGGDAEDEEG